VSGVKMQSKGMSTRLWNTGATAGSEDMPQKLVDIPLSNKLKPPFGGERGVGGDWVGS